MLIFFISEKKIDNSDLRESKSQCKTNFFLSNGIMERLSRLYSAYIVFHRIWQTFAYMTSELSYQHFISTTVQLVKMYSFQIFIWFLKNDIQKIKNKWLLKTFFLFFHSFCIMWLTSINVLINHLHSHHQLMHFQIAIIIISKYKNNAQL